jgi:hypothetical protein
MPDKAISQLTATTTLATTDIIPVVAGSTTSKITIENLFKNVPSLEVSGSVKLKNSASVSGSNISLTEFSSVLENLTGSVLNLTLPAGSNGLLKSLVVSSAVSNIVVSITNGVGVATLTFTSAGQAATLFYNDGWYVLSKNGAV